MAGQGIAEISELTNVESDFEHNDVEQVALLKDQLKTQTLLSSMDRLQKEVCCGSILDHQDESRRIARVLAHHHVFFILDFFPIVIFSISVYGVTGSYIIIISPFSAAFPPLKKRSTFLGTTFIRQQ